MPNRIKFKGGALRKEAIAVATITPGYLVELATATTVQKHSVAGGTAQAAFAVENEVVGNGIDVDYAANDTVLYDVMEKGAEVYALLAAAAVAIPFGGTLESAGDGTLRLGDIALAVRAAVTIGAVDAGVLFTASAPGSEGNDITVEYLTATAAAATVVVTGNAIVIKPDDTTPGTTDQANDIIALVNGDAAASALVVAAVAVGGDGTDAVVEPVATTNLAGGADSESGGDAKIAQALEAVDNSGGGVEARIKIVIL